MDMAAQHTQSKIDNILIDLATATIVSVVPHSLYLCRLYQLCPGRQSVRHRVPSTAYIVDILDNALVKC
jgi:hypothetical protein